MARVRSHFKSDSYINEVTSKLDPFVAPNGIIATGSDVIAHVILPPRFGASTARASGRPVPPPETSNRVAPAHPAPASAPARTSRARRLSRVRLNSRSRPALTAGPRSSSMVPPSFSPHHLPFGSSPLPRRHPMEILEGGDSPFHHAAGRLGRKRRGLDLVSAPRVLLRDRDVSQPATRVSTEPGIPEGRARLDGQPDLRERLARNPGENGGGRPAHGRVAPGVRGGPPAPGPPPGAGGRPPPRS